MERIKDQYTCLLSLEPSLGGFSPLSLEGKVLDLRVTGKSPGKLLTSGWWKVERQEVGEGGSKGPQSPSSLPVDCLVFLCLVMVIPAPPQMLSPFLPSRALLFAFQWIYSPPYLILIKTPISPHHIIN